MGIVRNMSEKIKVKTRVGDGGDGGVMVISDKIKVKQR